MDSAVGTTGDGADRERAFGLEVAALPRDARPVSLVALIQVETSGRREWTTRWSEDLSSASASALMTARLRSQHRRALRAQEDEQATPMSRRVERIYSVVAASIWWIVLAVALITCLVGIAQVEEPWVRPSLVVAMGLVLAGGVPQAITYLRRRF